MAKNLFEYLSTLIFDPPEKQDTKIGKACTDFEKTLNDKINSATEQEKRVLQNDKVEWEAKKKAVFHDGKYRTAEYDSEAAEMKSRQADALKAAIRLEGRAEKTYTKSKLNNFVKQFRLNRNTIADIYKELGYEETKIEAGKLPPLLSDAEFTTIEHNIKAIQKEKDASGKSDFSRIADLYSFAAYLAENADGSWRAKSTAELLSLFKAKSAQYMSRNDNLGHICLDLCTAGSTKVFKDDGSRKQYDNSLKYESLRTEVIDPLSSLGPESCRTASTADNAIKKIQKIFPDFEEALAVYNKAANIVNDPYIPETISYNMVCASCGAQKTFATLDEAKAAKCPVCGKPFFINCPKCKKIVPAVSERCPECDFFIAGAKNYQGYYDAAKRALDRFDLAEAQKQADMAHDANPQGAGLAELEKQLKAVKAEYEKPLAELNALVASNNYQAAQAKIAEIRRDKPKLNIAEIEKQVSARLEDANKKFAAASPAQKASVCGDILAVCADYKPALDYLAATPPAPCPSIKAEFNAASGVCNVSWTKSPDAGVTYTLVRKTGGAPANIKDGKTLFENQASLDYGDSSAEPGVYYGYSVFACRRETVSKAAPTAGLAVLFLEIDEKSLRKDVDENRCRVSWQLPKNCDAVRVIRKEGGVPGPGDKVVEANARDSFEDAGLQSGKLYYYRLQALYRNKTNSGTEPSAGITFHIRPQKKARPVEIAVSGREGSFEITWDSSQKGFKLRLVQLEQNVSVKKGQSYSDGEITSFGKTVAVCDSDDGAFTLNVRQKTFFSIAAFIDAGDGGIASNTVSLNTYEPCLIDELRFNESARSLYIVLKKPLPANLQTIYYAMSRKAGSGDPPWKTKGDVGEMQKVAAAAYEKSNGLCIAGISDEGAYYITVISAFAAAGSEVYAEPQKKRWTNSSPAKIKWGVKKALIGGAKFTVEFKASGMVTDLPELDLCYSSGGGFMNSRDDGISLYMVKGESLKPGQSKKYEFNLDKSMTGGISKGADMVLFVVDEDIAGEYDIGFVGGFSGRWE